MKVSIGTNIKEGPWGGGNLFAKSLKKYLRTTVIRSLQIFQKMILILF